MKKIILLFAVLITLTGYSQRTISNPKIVLDTTYEGTRFIYSWTDGLFLTQVVDSARWVNDTTQVFNFNYFSMNGSNIEIVVTKQRIVATGDTIVRREKIQIPFIEVWKAMSDFYGNAVVKKQIKKALKNSYKKKTYQE